MASRRMLNVSLMQSDRFTALPASDRLLFVYLVLNADDDGFVESPAGVARHANLDVGGIERLANAGFIKRFKTGIIVVSEWWLHNSLQNDRYTPTIYLDEKLELSIKAGRYVDFSPALGQVPEGANPGRKVCIQNVSNSDTERIHNINKNSIGKKRGEKNSLGERGTDTGSFMSPSLSDLNDVILTEHLQVNPMEFKRYYEASGWKDKGGRLINWKQKLFSWDKSSRERKNGDEYKVGSSSNPQIKMAERAIALIRDSKAQDP